MDRVVAQGYRVRDLVYGGVALVGMYVGSRYAAMAQTDPYRVRLASGIGGIVGSLVFTGLLYRPIDTVIFIFSYGILTYNQFAALRLLETNNKQNLPEEKESIDH